MEKEVFLLGRWSNYYELEEDLTLEELASTYDAIVEKEIRHNKFHARLAGAEIDDDDKEEQQSTLEDRLRQRTGNGAGTGGERGPTDLPTGVVGHQFIGG